MKHQIIQDHLRRIAAVEAANGEPIFKSPRSYIAAVSSYPELSPEAEQDIARIGGADAHRILFTCNLTYAAKMAFAMRRLDQDAGDMVSAANLGLWEAATRFKADKGAGFRTYAAFSIRNEILKQVEQSTSAATLSGSGSRAAKKTKHRLHAAKRELGFDGPLNDAQAAEVAAKLGVRDKDDVKAMDMALRGERVASFSTKAEVLEGVADEQQDEDWMIARLDAKRRLEKLNAALAELTERDRSIFVGRRIANPQATLPELAGRFGITRERVRQIENAVAAKLAPVAGEQL